VNVVVKGTQQGTATGAEGNFELTAPSPADTLVFSFVGYSTKEVPIDGRSQMDVTMVSQALLEEEVVVVGYGTQQRDNITSSVSSVDVGDIQQSSQSSLAGALDGQVAGVQVQTSGAPGEEPAIRIRGIGTFGNTSPLYIVDGTPVENIIDFDLGNIESIEVMKDAAASAIYGSRAASGVVIVETSQGQETGLQVNYSGSVSTANVNQRIDVLEREEFQEFNNRIRQNAGLEPAPANDPDSPEFIDDINTEWQDAALSRSVETNHDLNISGGNETSQYSVALGYESRKGTMQGPKPFFERFNARINSTHEVTERFTIGENVSLTRSEDRPQTSQFENPLFAEMLKAPPTIPVRDESRLGGFGGADTGEEEAITLNVVGANNLLEREQEVNRVLANVWGEYEIIDGLTYKANLSFDSRSFNEKFFIPTFDLGFFFEENQGELNVTENEVVNTTAENTLTYDDTFQNHNINVVAGVSQEREIFNQTFARGTGFERPFFRVVNAAESDQSEGFESESALRSIFGRIQYDYDGRYLLTASVRRDGSSRFGDANQWGNFPSVSAGWRISDEPFFDVSWIDNLKIRGSWGQLGRQQIGDFETQAFINTNATVAFGDQAASGATQVNLANNELRWEEQTSRAVGIDAALFDNRFNITAEYYSNKSEDILVGIPIPGSLGAGDAPPANAATMRNRGFEFVFEYNDNWGDFTYDLSTNITTLDNEVLSLGNGEPIFGNASKTEVGSEIGEIFGFVTDGIFQNQQEVENHADQEPGTAPGDIRFKDLNGDGVINDQDRTFLGSPTPDFTYGFTANLGYKNWDASFFVQGNYGNKIFNNTRQFVENMRDFNNTSERAAENAWSPDNQHNDVRFPRPVFNDPNENIRASDRWVEDGSYMRMERVTVGYTVPTELVDGIGLRNIRVYLSGENLFTITGYSGLDPELGTASGDAGINNVGNDGLFSRGFDGTAWPHPRRFETGIEVGF